METKPVKIIFLKVTVLFSTNTDHAQRKPPIHIFISLCCTVLISSSTLIVSLSKVLIQTWRHGYCGGGAFDFGAGAQSVNWYFELHFQM